MLDNDLKSQLSYAWSLPQNNRFVMKMQEIQDAITVMTPLATEFLRSYLYYIIRKIREAVTVSTYYVSSKYIVTHDCNRSGLRSIACRLRMASLPWTQTWVSLTRLNFHSTICFMYSPIINF